DRVSWVSPRSQSRASPCWAWRVPRTRSRSGPPRPRGPRRSTSSSRAPPLASRRARERPSSTAAPTCASSTSRPSSSPSSGRPRAGRSTDSPVGRLRPHRSAATCPRSRGPAPGGRRSASRWCGIRSPPLPPDASRIPVEPGRATPGATPIMPLLKGNLHAHTTFSDGRLPAEEVVARYRELGYDFLAITDHDDRIDESYWFRIPPSHDRMLVLPRVEIDYRPLGQHVGKVTGERETLYVLNHPARYALTVEQTVRRISTITRDGLPIHAVEITDTGVYQAEYDQDAIALPKVGTDDAHREEDFGRAWIEVDAAGRTGDDIIRAIKAGQFAVRFAPNRRLGLGAWLR